MSKIKNNLITGAWYAMANFGFYVIYSESFPKYASNLANFGLFVFDFFQITTAIVSVILAVVLLITPFDDRSRMIVDACKPNVVMLFTSAVTMLHAASVGFSLTAGFVACCLMSILFLHSVVKEKNE